MEPPRKTRCILVSAHWEVSPLQTVIPYIVVSFPGYDALSELLPFILSRTLGRTLKVQVKRKVYLSVPRKWSTVVLYLEFTVRILAWGTQDSRMGGNVVT